MKKLNIYNFNEVKEIFKKEEKAIIDSCKNDFLDFIYDSQVYSINDMLDNYFYNDYVAYSWHEDAYDNNIYLNVTYFQNFLFNYAKNDFITETTKKAIKEIFNQLNDYYINNDYLKKYKIKYYNILNNYLNLEIIDNELEQDDLNDEIYNSFYNWIVEYSKDEIDDNKINEIIDYSIAKLKAIWELIYDEINNAYYNIRFSEEWEDDFLKTYFIANDIEFYIKEDKIKVID